MLVTSRLYWKRFAYRLGQVDLSNGAARFWLIRVTTARRYVRCIAARQACLDCITDLSILSALLSSGKEYRQIATRFERLTSCFEAMKSTDLFEKFFQTHPNNLEARLTGEKLFQLPIWTTAPTIGQG